MVLLIEIDTTQELEVTNQNSGSTQRETVLPNEPSDEIDMKFINRFTNVANEMRKCLDCKLL